MRDTGEERRHPKCRVGILLFCSCEWLVRRKRPFLFRVTVGNDKVKIVRLFETVNREKLFSISRAINRG